LTDAHVVVRQGQRESRLLVCKLGAAFALAVELLHRITVEP